MALNSWADQSLFKFLKTDLTATVANQNSSTNSQAKATLQRVAMLLLETSHSLSQKTNCMKTLILVEELEELGLLWMMRAIAEDLGLLIFMIWKVLKRQ